VTRVNDWTRATLRNDGDSNRVTFLPNDSTRVTVEDWSQSHFYKISKRLIDKHSSFAHKEMSFFCFSGDQHLRKYSVLTVFPSAVMMHFKYQVFRLTRR